MTGESLLAERVCGETVLAGSLVVSGSIDIEVQHSGVETTAARLAALLDQRVNFKSELQRRGEAWSDRMAAPVLVVSTLSVPLIGPSAAIVLLFAAPSNALRATGSLQTASRLTALSRRGILVRDGCGLEVLDQVDTVLFDKTGTLTEDTLEVEEIRSIGGLDEQRLLELVVAIEQRMTHPIARALLAHAKAQGCELLAGEELELGGGVRGRVAGHEVLLGSRRFIATEGVVGSIDSESATCTEVWVAVDGQLEGVLLLRPRIRPEAAEDKASLTMLPTAFGESAALRRGLNLTLGGWAGYGLAAMVASGVFRMAVVGATVAYATAVTVSALHSTSPLIGTFSSRRESTS